MNNKYFTSKSVSRLLKLNSSKNKKNSQALIQKLKLKIPHLQKKNRLYFQKILNQYQNQSLWIYWCRQLLALVDISWLTQNTDNHEKLIQFWSSHELSKEFLESKAAIKKRSTQCLKLQQQNLIVFAQKYLAPKLKKGKLKFYRKLPDIGETSKLCATYSHGDQTIQLFGNSRSSLKSIQKRLENAFDILKKICPDDYRRFFQLTHTIVCTSDPAVVSFSNQELAGYSTQNFTHRDDIDLLDDLLHETGHHHLNRILDLQNLIIEDDEEIFYSPWRNSLRPIRGIYHGFFTFAWAYLLFAQLLNHQDFSKIFQSHQARKIRRRLFEEHLYLERSIKEITKAYQLGKITAAGKKVIQQTLENLYSVRFIYLREKSNLSKIDKQQLKTLKEKLSV